VTVVLSNEDGTLDRSQVVSAAGTENVGGVSEITIKRRVKETEDNYYSYYYLNGRSVNLSDVQDLLAAAGVTPEGYNVVMQGDVTEIINMTPTSAGDHRRDRGRRRIRREEGGRLRGVGDRRRPDRGGRSPDRREAGPTRSLADERETALQYQQFRDELEEYRGFLKASELEEKRETLAGVEEDIDDDETELEELRAELDARQGKLTRLEEDLADLNHEIETKGEDEQIEIRSEIEEVKGEISRLEDKIEAAEERAAEAETERRDAFVQIDRKEETIEELESEIREAKVEKASVKSEIATKRSELADVEAEIEGADTEFDELKAELAEKKEAIESLRGRKNGLQREKDRLLDEARRRSNAVSEARTDLEDARESIPEHKARISELHSELDKATKNEETIEDAVADLFAEKAETSERLEAIEEDLREKQNEYAKLEAAADQRGDTSWPRAVTEVKNGGIDGVHGAVGELGSVEAEYAEACETAAGGGRLANVVVDDDGVGSTCIDYLKQRNAGRATFLPITKMDNRSLPRKPSVPGVVDFARNLVDYDSEYESIFSYVLGSTLIVEDMATARDLMGDYRMVTLDGDLVEKSGAMTGGSGGGSRYAFTKSGGGKLERLATDISEREDERQALQAEVDELEDDIDDARDRKADAAERVRSLEADVERAEDELADAEDRIDELKAELEDMEAERESVDAEMTELDDEIDDLNTEIDELDGEIEEIETELADSKIPGALGACRRDPRGDLGPGRPDEFARRAAQRARTGEGVHGGRGRRPPRHRRDGAKSEGRGRRSDRRPRGDDRREGGDAGSETRVDRGARSGTDGAEGRPRGPPRGDHRGDPRARRAALALVSEAESDLEDLTDRRDRLAWEIDELESQVGEYDADEIPDLDEVESRIEELEEEMAALEPVNMLAIDEYDEVEEALETLQERRDVLVEERDAIAERIEGYEAEKKRTFMETFESINDQFEDIFARLSAGSGELLLENPEDPFEEGLTMKAQPADKPVQRLDAMSGGEKSLTALSFIFAIQRHNPAPFYALDEIDAFLDAVNAERVGEMIEELAEEAQFVVVGHRSALLERSDRAIGVTMQGDNLSAVTGMQFGDDGDEEVTADD